MKKRIYLFIPVLLLLPMLAFGDGYKAYIPWPSPEDTIKVPDGEFLNTFIANDTAGLLWQGGNGTTAWQNRSRVYVLLKNASYYWSAACTINVADRKLCVRAEHGGNYAIPTSPVLGDRKPKIFLAGSGSLPNNMITINAVDDTICLKNISLCGYDEINHPENFELLGVNMIQIGASGSGSIYIDSCVLKTVTGRLHVLNGSPKTIRITNSIYCDAGNLVRSNLGTGRAIDCGNSGIDTLDIQNNTFFNFLDRIVRHQYSIQPIKTFMFNHNSVFNCASYHGFLDLGWIDSTGNGTFQIKDNLFVDNFALGPDTDHVRQYEFAESPDLDPNNGLPKMSWVVARQNSTGNITPWEISNNYYHISDSGWSIRNFTTTLHQPVYNSNTKEPFLTSDIIRQLLVNGGDTLYAFQPVFVYNFISTPELMTKLCKWYFSDASDGIIPFSDPDSAVGAGAGKIKNTAMPVAHFISLSGLPPGSGRWPYDCDRITTDWLMDFLDCSYLANIELSYASSDGKTIGSTFWRCYGPPWSVNKPITQIPQRFSLSQNYPNPFNPATTIEYEAAKAGLVTLKVYDLLGREVATLVNEFKQIGAYPAIWNASGFASGIYFYRLQAGSFTETKKLLLLK